MENDDSQLGFCGRGEGSGEAVGCKRANLEEGSQRLDSGGDFEKKHEDSLGEVNSHMNLGLGGEPSSSSSSKNKGPQLLSCSWNMSTSFENEIHYLAPVQKQEGSGNVVESSVMKTESTINDLTDDLLHVVFSFLDTISLRRAASVCRQWSLEASSHEEFWRCLNLEDRFISWEQFENMCEVYTNATEVNICGVNICGAPAIYPLEMKAISSFRNLENLTMGKCQIDEAFFQDLTDCRTLKKLTITNATLRNGFEEIPIYHDRLVEVNIIKCRLLRITVRCPQLESLSLKRSNLTRAVLDCPLLQELNIASCHKLSDAAIRSAISSCPQLENLDMSYCSSLSDETLQFIAMACGNLHVLDASYCPKISFDSVNLPMLTVLKLHSCEGITSSSMAAIALSSMLEVLELDNCSLLTTVSLKFADLSLQSDVLSSVTISNCPSLQSVSITSNALKKLVLQKQECLTTLALQCPCLQDVDLSECKSLTNSICEVFTSGGGCPVVRSLVLDGCKGLTAVSFHSTTLVSLSLGCCEITSLELRCPYLQHVSLDGCDRLERASFSPVNLKTLNLGICPKLIVLHLEAPLMVSLELKGCGVLSEAFLKCPRLTSLDASFCRELKDDFLFAITSNCRLVESLVLMLCDSVGPNGLSSLLLNLPNLTYLDLSYTLLVDLQPVFRSCLNLKVLKLAARKSLSDSSLEPLYKNGALPALQELDLSNRRFSQSSIEELLAGCTHLTHITLNGCVNLHDLDWGSSHHDKPSEISTSYGPFGRYSSESDQSSHLLQTLNCVGCPNIKRVFIPPTMRSFRLSSLNLALSSSLKEVDLSCRNLLSLNLSNCCSLQVLKLNCPRLTSLLLQSCNIDKEVVKAAITQCYMLETLDVRYCPKISPYYACTFREVCPRLKHIYNRQCEKERG